MVISHPYGEVYPYNGGYYPYQTSAITSSSYTTVPLQWNVQTIPQYDLTLTATPAPPPPPPDESPLEWLDRRVSEITELLTAA